MELFWKKKKKQDWDNITGDKICQIYYTLKQYQSNNSPNIAVIKNKRKFEWQIKVWKEKMDKTRGDTITKLSNDKYQFFINEVEVNIIHIRNLQDIINNKIYYKKYM